MKAWFKAALGGIGLVLCLVCIFTLFSFEQMPVELQLFEVVSMAILALLVVKMGREAYTERRKHQQDIMMQRIRQTMESPHFSDEPSPDSILYLRPFKVDEKYMSEVEYAGKWYNSFESLICRMVTDAGKPIAIGRPGEELQPLGAQRIYATDDTWQAKVSEYFQVSKYVILYADFTPGVKWEIENAITRYRDKLILIPRVYNQRETAVRKVSLFDITFLSDIFYSLWVNHFLFKKAHRGREYYRSWNALMKKHMAGIKMDDRISAVIFENGKAVPFYARKPNQEEQFLAIHRAINTKLGIRPQPELLRKKKEKPLLTLCADLGMKSAKSAVFYPCAMGAVEFYAQGLRYKSLFGFWWFNREIAENYRTLKRYRKNRLIPYASIREVLPVKENCLQLILEETNGSLYLSVPAFHQEHIRHMKNLLQQCCRESRFPSEVDDSLAQAFRQQSKDYTKAFFLMEAVSLALGVLLFILAIGGSYLALFTLLVLGTFWNLGMVMLSYIYTWNSGKRGIRFLGILAMAIHIWLYIYFQM